MAAFVVERVFIFERSSLDGLTGKDGGLSGLRPFVGFGDGGPGSGGGMRFVIGLVKDVIVEVWDRGIAGIKDVKGRAFLMLEGPAS